MAIYTDYNTINEYMKMGSAKDSCYICAKKLGTTPKQDAYEIMRKLQGQMENKPMVITKKSGVDTCICMNCIKEIYDTHIAPTITTTDIAPTADIANIEEERTIDKKKAKK